MMYVDIFYILHELCRTLPNNSLTSSPGVEVYASGVPRIVGTMQVRHRLGGGVDVGAAV